MPSFPACAAARFVAVLMFCSLPLATIVYFVWIIYKEVVRTSPEAKRIFFEVEERNDAEIGRWERWLEPIIGSRRLDGDWKVRLSASILQASGSYAPFSDLDSLLQPFED